MNGSPFLGVTTEGCSAIPESRFTGSVYASLYPAFENTSELFLPENTSTKKLVGLSNLPFGITDLTIPKVLAFTSRLKL